MSYLKTIKKYFDDYILEEKQRHYDEIIDDIKIKYNIGKVIVNAQGWKYNTNYGDRLIKEWSKELVSKYGSYFSIDNLKNMRSIYLNLDEEYKNSNYLNFDYFLLETIVRKK